MALLLLLACLADQGSAPPTGAPTGGPPSTPPTPGSPGGVLPGPSAPGPPRRLHLTLNVLGAEGGYLTALGPEGEMVLELGPTAGTVPPRGALTYVEATPTPDGRYVVDAFVPHQGLGIVFGTVRATTAERLTIESPLGTTEWIRNRWADVPADLAVGHYVSVKHYQTPDGAAILNVRRFPGRVEEVGVVQSPASGGAGSAALSLYTLGGARTYPAASSFAPGSIARVLYRRDARTPFKDLAVEAADADALLFVGKLSTWSAPSLAMVDAWGNRLGVVTFRYDAVLPEGLVAGDLAEVRYTFAADGTPLATEVTERVLSTVYFGTIDRLDESSLTVTTLQRQAHTLRRTPDTWFPGPVQVGDKADVIWRADPTGGPNIAEVVVKE